MRESLAIPFVERPVDRTELHIADEIRLVGTLAELTPVVRVDDFRLPDNSPVTDLIAATFWNAVRGVVAAFRIRIDFYLVQKLHSYGGDAFAIPGFCKGDSGKEQGD